MRVGEPIWPDESLKQHYERHPRGKDEECWRELLGKTAPAVVSIIEYEDRSIKVFRGHWLAYDAQELNRQAGYGDFYPVNKYYVDRALIKLIVTSDLRYIRTCFHEHFQRPHKVGSFARPLTELATVYSEKLRDRAGFGHVKDLVTRLVDARLSPDKDLAKALRLILKEAELKSRKRNA